MVIWIEIDGEIAKKIINKFKDIDAGKIHAQLKKLGVKINRKFGGVTIVRIPPDTYQILIAIDDKSELKLKQLLSDVLSSEKFERLKMKFKGTEKRVKGRIFEIQIE